MKILIYVGHPAQLYFFKNAIKYFKDNKHDIFLVIKSKDVLENLVKKFGFEYNNILSEGRKESRIGIIWGLIKRDIRLLKIAFFYKPDILLGSDASLAHVGFLINKPVITTSEDDYTVIPYLAKLTYPFTSHIVTPEVCDVGKWYRKKVGYNGYMKLAYLHPKYFNSGSFAEINNDSNKILIRTSKLNAHHDFRINGLDLGLIKEIISRYGKTHEIFISSEYVINSSLKSYLLRISPEKIHQFLLKCKLLISDSQSMSMEAAMLGIPSIRFSDFAGKISVLEELEHKYKLTYGFKSSETELLFDKLDKLLKTENLREVFEARRQKMLKDKIDITAFMVWLIENYPDSIKIMKENPDYQYIFK